MDSALTADSEVAKLQRVEGTTTRGRGSPLEPRCAAAKPPGWS